jgi:O-antigen/teichoic acid export membrane protein
MKTKQTLAKHSIFYVLANGVEATVPFLLAPILTRSLDQTDFGLWVLFTTYATFLRPIIGLTAQDAIRMRFLDFDREQLKHFMHTLFFIMIAIMAAACGIVIAFQGTIAELTKFPGEWWVTIVASALLFELFYTVLALEQFHGRHREFLVIQVIQALLAMGFIAAFLVMGWGWKGVIIGRMVSLATATVVSLKMLDYPLLNFVRIPKRAFYRDVTRFGVFYAPSGMVIMAMALIDKMVAAHMLGVAASALYGVAALFASAFWVVNNSFLMAWTPWLFQRLRRQGQEKQNEIVSVSLLYFAAATCMASAIYVVSVWVAPVLLGAEFHEAIPLTRYMMAAILLQGFFMHNMKFLHHDKRILVMSFCSALALGLNLALSIAWAPTQGLPGIMIATVISFGAAFVVSGIMVLSPLFKTQTRVGNIA